MWNEKHGEILVKFIGSGQVRIEDRWGDEITVAIEDLMAFARAQAARDERDNDPKLRKT